MSTGDPPSPRSQLVAALVAAHVAVMVLLSIPLPPKELAAGEPNAAVDGAVAWWAERVAAVGVPRDRFEPLVRQVAGAWARALGGARAVVYPYSHTFGVLQGWTMFGTVKRDSALPEIEVREHGAWRAVYVARSDEHTWNRSLFEHDRTRTWLYEAGWRGKRSGWESFADWAATAAHRDFPEATAVRVQLRAVALPPPEELRATGSLRYGKAFRIEERSW